MSILPTGNELSSCAQHDLKRALQCLIAAAAIVGPNAYGQERIPTKDRVVVTEKRPPERKFVSFWRSSPRDIFFAYSIDTDGPPDDPPQGEPEPPRNPEPDISTDCDTNTVTSAHASMQNNPVDVTNGLKHVDEVDFQSVSIPDLGLSRYKNPLWRGSGILGQGWITNLDLKISFSGESGTCYPTPGAAPCNVASPETINLNTERGGVIPFKKEQLAWVARDGAKIRYENGRYKLQLQDSAFSPVMTFYPNGFIDRVDRRDGTWVRFDYDGTKLTQALHSSGRSIVLRWGSSMPAVVTSIIAPNGKTFGYGYYYTGTNYASGLNSPILRSVTFPDGKGNVEYVHEEGFHNVYGSPQPYTDIRKLLQLKVNGVPLSNYSYQPGGKVASSSLADGTNSVSYSYFNGRTESVNAYGKTTTYVIVGDRVTEVIGAASSNCLATASFVQYGAGGQIEYTVNGRDIITRYEYDSRGRKVRQIEAAGTPEQRVTTWEWDSTPNASLRTDLLKRATVGGVRETAYEYFNENVLDHALPKAITVKNLSSNGVNGETRRTAFAYTFHSNGMVASVTEDGPSPGASDAVVTFYSSAGDVVSVQNALGHRRVFSGHNGFGQPAKVVNENGDTVEYEYDPRGRITTVRNIVNGLPQTSRFVYDQFARLSRIEGPDGRIVNREYDQVGRLVREYEEEAQGRFAVTRYTYDVASNLASVVKERATAVHPPVVPALSVPALGAQGAYTVTWSSVPGADRYLLQQSLNTGGWTLTYEGGALSKGFSGMAVGSHNYRVQACNSVGCSAVSTSASVNVVYKPTAAPSIGVPAQVTNGTYTVGWTAIATSRTYRLEESVNGGGWAVVQNTAATIRNVTGKTGGTYSYRVSACNEAGCGPISSSVSVVEVDPPTSLATFSAPPAVNISGSYTISWSSVSGASSYVLEESANGGSWVAVHNAAPATKSLSGKSTSIAHSYRVKACNVAGCGGYSAIATVQRIIYGADFVSQVVPSLMAAGKPVNVQVTMRNTGNTTWTDATAYRLGSHNPVDNKIWGLHRVPVAGSIAPGSTATFSFQVTPPAAGGTYNFQWRMVRDGHSWLGAVSPNVSVAAVSGSISASPNPCSMYIGETSCSSRVTWQSNRSDAQIWVTNLDNSGSQLFAAGQNGGQYAPWISSAGKRFHLKVGAITLATVDVRGHQTNQYPPGPPEPECPEFHQCEIR